MPYDLSEAFEKIEDELTGSLIKNLKRHKAEETELGFRWEQWQALQLKALEDYRRNNLKKFPPRYSKLNNQIRTILQDSYNDGSTKQEKKIMQAIKRGFKGKGTNSPAYTGEAKIEGDFFRTNDRKLDSLVESVTHDMERAEYAVLRRTNDRYRQIIFNAQVYANTGAGTYEKAVDMATRDFLRAGIDSIEYSNGSRHTISDYADMAIKTASKRAYLQGEGAMREEWGIVTVILNKRACPCPLCAPFVGKVFIDDVWSGGQGVAGTDYGISPITGVKYPLLSAAIRQGLYHPRCRDVHTTYFEGVSTPPEDSEYTADELDALAEKYNAEQKQNYCERQEKKYDRISKYSLDEENQRIYGARAKAFGDKAKEFKKLSDSINIPAETVENFGGSGIIDLRKGGNSDVDYIQNPSTGRMEGSRPGGGSGSSGGSSSGSTSSETKEQKILKQKVKDGELTKTIYVPKQELHYQGTKQHEDYTKTHGGIEKSYFTVPISELQSILDEKFATGRVHIFSDGKITEIFDCGKIVGYDTLLKRETSFVKVHYSKLKTHMVPHVKNE